MTRFPLAIRETRLSKPGPCLLATLMAALLPLTALGADDATFARFNGLDVSYRDMGVMIHHTRQPFKTTASGFAKNISADPNWTNPTIMRGMTRAANSAGQLVRGRARPVDVAMTVLWPKGKPGSTCVVSYRGTDRDHKYDPSLDDLIRIKEHLIPASTRAATFSGNGRSCVMKNGYLQNYLETRSQVMDFLNDATSAGQCSRGVVFLGMSLGGATASVAFTDLMMVKSATANDRLGALVQAKKLWLVTAGAPRAVSDRCAADVQRIAGSRAKRFIYGSLAEEEAENNKPLACGRYVDPVPGNPSMVRFSTHVYPTGHFGKAVVGHNTYTGDNPSTPAIGFLARQRCRSKASCKSKRYANRLSRVATRTAEFAFPSDPKYPRIGRDSGASCTALGLIPRRDYMFGRFHDTCSYRNMMAAYGQKHAGEPSRSNHPCALPFDRDDPADYPQWTCPLGPNLGNASVRTCVVDPIQVNQLHQP